MIWVRFYDRGSMRKCWNYKGFSIFRSICVFCVWKWDFAWFSWEFDGWDWYIEEVWFLSWCVDELTCVTRSEPGVFVSFCYPPIWWILCPQKVTKNKHFWYEYAEKSHFFCAIVVTSSTAERQLSEIKNIFNFRRYKPWRVYRMQ